MKALIYLIITSTMVCLYTGCKMSPENKTGEVVIPMDFTNPKSVHEIGLIHDVQVINLDCEEIVFAEIAKIVRHNDRIYLMDRQHNRAVLIYDTIGNLVNVISKHGQGPEEYIQLSDIFVDTEDGTLNILSRVDRKLLRYDLNGERLIKLDKLPKSFGQMAKAKNGYVGYMRNYREDSHPFNVWSISDSLRLRNSFFEIDPSWSSRGFGDGAVFSSYQDHVYYITPMDYNIYEITDSTISIPYSFDMGSATWPGNAKKSDQYDQVPITRRVDLVDRFHYFQETTSHLIALVVHGSQHKLCVYCKETAESFLVNLDTYAGKYLFPFGLIIGIDETAIYTLVKAPDMKRMASGRSAYVDYEAQHPEQVKRLREKFPTIKEDGNPFLVIYYIR